jgi:hypothetical protein
MRAFASTQRKPQIIVLTNYDLPEYKKRRLPSAPPISWIRRAITGDFRKCCTTSAKRIT